MALVCPNYLVAGKMIVLARACPRYIVRAFFEKLTLLALSCPSYIVRGKFKMRLPFLQFFVPVSSRKKI